MNQGQKYNFIKIIQQKSLLIPQIQRDYVQHRTSYKVKESRSQLLKSLVDVAKGDKENINLNFVYGYSDFIFSESSNNGPLKRYDCFVPIDGQQRLTTLYLLHLFVYAKSENGDVSKFKNKLFYQTRETTKNFINKLTDEISNIINDNNICNAIKNSSWYSSVWEFDVSVKSCLKVLEEIQDKFEDFNKWDDAKENLNKISFMLLNITELGKPNELYIKMNSRGRQLTPFENFKSDLYGYIDEEFKNDPDFILHFKQGLDNEWQENIWSWFENIEFAKQYTDELTKEIIHWIIVSRKIVDHKSDKESGINLQNLNLTLEPHEKDCYMIYPKTATPEKYWLETYKIKDSKWEIKDIYNTFYLFSKISDELRKYLFNSLFGTISEKNKFNKSINQYPARIRLLAISLYSNKIEEDFDEDNFKEWYRIINNIANHSEIDTIDRFYIATKTIHKLSEQHSHTMLKDLRNCTDDLYNLLKHLPNIKDEQIKEECYKAKLIEDPDWNTAIEKAESHEYFKGEIYFALCNCNDSNSFKERWEKISEIFNDNGNDILLKKYFLNNQIKDVFPYSISDKYCMYYWNDKHHNNDWRGFLRKEEGRKAFNEFLTAYINSGERLKEFVDNEDMQTISNVAMSDEFKSSLLKNDEMLSYMGYGRYMFENGNYYLLKSDDRSRGVDYKLFEAYIKLKNKYRDITLPEFTSKDDISNTSLFVSGKKISFENDSYLIDGKSLNSIDVERLKKEI
ncbi:MAG: DUF262 domain-containing protein [Clostridia bacterium]|nr:DUF262 domain-containing protein [Clostridia bacterium]